MGRVYDYLREGEKHAIDAAALQNHFRITGRQLRKAVEAERIAGCPILSTAAGYFRPRAGSAGDEDIKRFCRIMSARMKTTGSIIQAVAACASDRSS